MKIFYPIVFLIFSQCSLVQSDLNRITDDKKIDALIIKENEIHPFPIYQGLTTSDFTELRLISTNGKELSFNILEKDKAISNFKTDKSVAGETGYTVYKFSISKLDPSLKYTFQVIENGNILDQRTFKTIDLKKTDVKIGVMSCLDDKFKNRQFMMWNGYLKQDTDYTFLIGDNVYADSLISTVGKVFKFKYAKEETLWQRYVETFRRLSYFRSSRLVPTLAIWDDHDYGFNNGDQTYPYKLNSLKIFNTFFGVEDIKGVTQKLKGAGYIFNGFNQRFVFIDARSFRSEFSLAKSDKETKWGFQQTEMIMNSLKEARPTWLIQGDQYFGAYHVFESSEKTHPNDFQKILKSLKEANSKVIFISGDRHLNELMKIDKEVLGYETYELTSSGMHAAVFPNRWKKNPNPRQIEGAAGKPNYSIVEVKSSEPWVMDVETFGPNMNPLFEKELSINK